MFEVFARYATEVVQSYGEGALWWGVKNVDYFQPELMNAARDYSVRFDKQTYLAAKYIMSKSPSNPLYKIINILLEDLIKKHGKKAVIKAIENNGIKITGKAALNAAIYTIPIKDMTAIVLESIFKSAVLLTLSRIAINTSLTLGVAFQSLQFQSAKSFIWLANKNRNTAKKLYDLELDALFFLVKDEYIKLTRSTN